MNNVVFMLRGNRKLQVSNTLHTWFITNNFQQSPTVCIKKRWLTPKHQWHKVFNQDLIKQGCKWLQCFYCKSVYWQLETCRGVERVSCIQPPWALPPDRHPVVWKHFILAGPLWMDSSVFWVCSISKLSARVDIINTVFSVRTRERNKRLAGEPPPQAQRKK